MEFFNKIKLKLRVKNMISTIIYLVLACVFILLAFSIGFSTDVEWQYGILGADWGIPIPNWVIACFCLLLAIIFFFLSFGHAKSFIKNTEFQKMIKTVKTIGNINDVGMMLASMNKSPYVEGGELRFNDKLVFYLKSTEVNIIASESIEEIQAEITKMKDVEEIFISIYYDNEILKIKTNKKNVSVLLGEMRKTLLPSA